MPEVPENMQENIAHMELEAHAPRNPSSSSNQTSPSYPPRASSHQGTIQNHHHQQQQQQQQSSHGEGQWLNRQASISSTFKQPPSVQPQSIHQQQQSSHDYHNFAQQSEVPNFSIFPQLTTRPPNVPPSDDEKEAVLENARMPVLNSNDPEMQLAWAQDALAYVDTAQLQAHRLADLQGVRPATPAVEHQLRVDAMNVTGFLADQSHPKAEFMRGMWLEFGKFGLRGDKKEAFRCYTRAAQKGYARAEYRMGMQFEQSNDPIRALQHYKAGSEAGDSASNYRLGMMTLLGQHGQQQDFARGIQLVRQAAVTADENAPQGAYVLGMLQARELPQINVPEIYLPYDEKAARQNIEKAAYLGFAKAQLKMGSAFELCSLGCEFNPTLSLHYNALASRQGEAEADMAISKWFLCGNEGEFSKNEELAYQYAERAAAAHLATAEFAMGYFNEIGMHVPVNLDKAMEWYKKAARNGNTDAQGRIDSVSNSRTLSKKDHEKVAINKIKSQHGSMRGQRPVRLQKQTAPALPTIDSSPSEYGDSLASPGSGGARMPDRNASTTPYPISDRPPTISAAPSSAPYDRPATAAPYPTDNGPPRLDSRSSLAGGFAPELRSASARPPSQAFNINPSVYSGAPNLRDPYGRGRTPAGASMGSLPIRPATSIDTMGRGGGRLPSGGPPAGLGGYRQSSGTASVPRPEQYDRPSTVQPYDSSYGAPNKLQKPGQLKKTPTLPDIGYVAPIDHRQPGRPPARPPSADGRISSRPERPPTTGPASRPGVQRPSPGPGAATRPAPASQASRPSQVAPSKQPAPRPSAGKGPKEPALKAGASQGAGNGPKTFDEMGIANAPKDQDCVSRHPLLAYWASEG